MMSAVAIPQDERINNKDPTDVETERVERNIDSSLCCSKILGSDFASMILHHEEARGSIL